MEVVEKHQQHLVGIPSDSSSTSSTSDEMKMNTIYDKVRYLVSGNAVVVFTIGGCCMCHVVKQLLFSLGVGPTVVELDREEAGLDIHGFLSQIAGEGQQHPVPAVFVGGKFLGGVETLMACVILMALLFHTSRMLVLSGSS